MLLTSVSSYTDRDILVTRDASQLTGSVTYSTSAAIRRRSALDSPLLDYTTVEVFTQELRLTSDYEGRFQWVLGGFYSDIERDYGQTLPTPGYDAIVEGCCAVVPRRAAYRARSWARRSTRRSSRAFRTTSSSWRSSPRLRSKSRSASTPRSAARYYDFEEERDPVLRRRCLPTALSTPTLARRSRFRVSQRKMVCCLACCCPTTSSENFQLNAQGAEGFRLGGINDPLNMPLCSAEDIVTFGGRPTVSTSEALWNYELGAKIGFAGGRGQFNIAAFHAEIDDLQCRTLRAPARRVSSINVPEAHATGVGVRADRRSRPTASTSASARPTRRRSSTPASISTIGGVTTVMRASRKATACRPCRNSSCRPTRPTAGR